MNRHDEASHLPAVPNRNGSYEDHVMAPKALPSQEVLRQLLRYDPDTGRLFWRERSVDAFPEGNGRSAQGRANIWNAKNAGREALANISGGYKRGRVLGMPLSAHRVVFMLINGYCPDVIDHANGNKLDNRVENLRPASPAENARNYTKPAGSSSQYRGVTKTSKASSWSASIGCYRTKKKIHIGCFKSEIEAAQAYDKVAREMHGDFATVNFPAALRGVEGQP